MTDEEVRKVTGAALRVDNGCGNCAHYLIKDLGRLFPEHADHFKAAYREEYEGWMD